MKGCCDVSCKKQKCVYQHVSDFEKCRIVAYRNFGLSYRRIAARVGRDPLTVNRIGNRWIQDGVTSYAYREDRHVTRMVLRDRAATSRAPSQELGSFARQQVSARTVVLRLQQHGISARTP
ncbi:HTH_Tnp_Tc3_2 domain-containing protein [Trichonephila clavipes]|nr:HTH_Tnp_Tc3_2 domain-containing protein [Trichonephila clavipes]